MKFDQQESQTGQRPRGQNVLFTGIASALLLVFLAGCGSSEVYRAPVEHRGAVVNGHAYAGPASHTLTSEAPRPAGHGPNYDMAMVAKEMVGVRYRYGGSSPSSGFDCSGLIYYSYKRIGLRSPRTTRDLLRQAQPVSRSDLRAGDILFFKLDGKKVSHAAIYLGNGRMVHAPSSGKRVSYASLRTRFWRNRFIGAGRLY